MMYFIIKTFLLGAEIATRLGANLKMKYQLEIFYLVADDIYNENEDDFMTMTIRSSCMIVTSLLLNSNVLMIVQMNTSVLYCNLQFKNLILSPYLVFVANNDFRKSGTADWLSG